MEEKLSTIYLVSGQTALQYLMSVSKKYRQIATEAICLRKMAKYQHKIVILHQR